MHVVHGEGGTGEPLGDELLPAEFGTFEPGEAFVGVGDLDAVHAPQQIEDLPRGEDAPRMGAEDDPARGLDRVHRRLPRGVGAGEILGDPQSQQMPRHVPGAHRVDLRARNERHAPPVIGGDGIGLVMIGEGEDVVARFGVKFYHLVRGKTPVGNGAVDVQRTLENGKFPAVKTDFFHVCS